MSMNTSASNIPRWTQRLSSENGRPTANDLRLSSAHKVQAKMVAASSGLMNAMKYMVSHPLEFIASTAVSAVSFYAVKTLVVWAFPAVGVGLAAAMVTAAVLSIGRGMVAEYKHRNACVAALYEDGKKPSEAELAEAKNIDIGKVLENGVTRALVTGLLGGITGILIGSFAQDAREFIEERRIPESPLHVPTEAEFEKTLDLLRKKENYGGFGDGFTVNPEGRIGGLQFGEAELTDLGYYQADGTSKIDWNGGWTDKAKQLGVDSVEDFKDNEEFQRMVEHDWIKFCWKDILYHDLDEQLGRTVIANNGKEFIVNPTSLIVGRHFSGSRGLELLFEQGIDSHDGGSKRIGTWLTDYMQEFSHRNMPFAAGNPEQLAFYMPNVTGDCSQTIAHIWPLELHEPQRISDHFGARGGNHDGIDIATYKRYPSVMATASGVVQRIESINHGYGNNVIILHEDGTRSLYGHMRRFADGLVEGQTVQQGEVIGQVGSTGHSTGPHLHYELRDARNRQFNPLPCLPDFEITGRHR